MLAVLLRTGAWRRPSQELDSADGASLDVVGESYAANAEGNFRQRKGRRACGDHLPGLQRRFRPVAVRRAPAAIGDYGAARGACAPATGLRAGSRLIARSLMAAMVSDGFTPGLAGTVEPSQISRFS